MKNKNKNKKHDPQTSFRGKLKAWHKIKTLK